MGIMAALTISPGAIQLGFTDDKSVLPESTDGQDAGNCIWEPKNIWILSKASVSDKGIVGDQEVHQVGWEADERFKGGESFIQSSQWSVGETILPDLGIVSIVSIFPKPSTYEE